MLATLKTGPAGEVGVHARGAVHRRHHAPPDDDARQARRQARRHADRDRGPRGLQYRRLWRPRRRDARRGPRQPASPPIAAPTRRPTATRSTPTWSRPAAFAATARRRRPSPSNARWTIWRRLLGLDPFEIRRKNMIRPGDWIESVWKDPSDVDVRQLWARSVPRPRRDGARRAGAAARSPTATTGSREPASRWRCWIAVRRRSIAPAPRCGCCRRQLSPRRRIDRDGQRLGHLAPPDRRRGARRAGRQHRHRQCRHRPDAVRYRHLRQHRHGGRRPGGGADRRGPARQHPGLRQPRTPACRLGRLPARGRRRCLRRPADRRSPSSTPRARAAGHRFEAKRKAYLSPRTVAFNVQGVRVAVHRVTGEIRILHSVHAADIGRLINPMQCRGQIDGAIAMGFGWALTENMVHDADGAMVNPALRNYRIPAFADVPPQRGALRRHLRHASARSAPNRRANARSIPSRPRSPMPSPMRPACASRTCRCRPTASSPGSARAAARSGGERERLGACRRNPARAMRRVQLRGGARRQPARRTFCTLSRLPRAPTKQMGPYHRSSARKAIRSTA